MLENNIFTTSDSYITVADFLDANILPEPQLLSGKGGLSNPSSLIIVLETPDGLDWLRGTEILMTTGYALGNSAEARLNLISKAKEKGVAAICIKEGRYFGEISEELLNQSNQLDLPLILLPYHSNYSYITRAYYAHLFAQANRDLLMQNIAYNEILSISTENTTLSELISKVEKIIGCKIKYRNHYQQENLLINFDKVDTRPKFITNQTDKYTRFVVKADEILSYIDVYSEAELSSFQTKVIEYTISVVRNILLNKQKNKWNESELHQTLGLILYSNISNPNYYFLRQIKEIMHWEEERYYVLFFRHLESEQKYDNNYISDIRSREINKNIRKYLEESLSNKFIFVENREEMIMFVNSNRNELTKLFTILFQNTKELARKIHIGCSSESTTLHHLGLQLQQAKSASMQDHSFSFFDDLGIEKYLNNFVGDRNSIALYKQTIEKLIEYDSRHQSKLMETLISYFKCDMNRTKTADELFIHTETLRYRLKQIEEITSLSPYTSEGIFQLMLALGINNLNG